MINAIDPGSGTSTDNESLTIAIPIEWTEYDEEIDQFSFRSVAVP
tara:strand:- start:67 stop:201 length:135 start_codon:yes stop_codon:yes gene_type:complete